MAVQPPPAPPAPVVPQQAVPPPPTRTSGCFGRGCGCSLLGCLLVVILVVLLAGGGGWWFFVVQASAAVTAPANLVVINQPITVNENPGIPGQQLNANDAVKTGTTGHGAIDFPDGSFLRMAPDTEVRINKVQLQKNGNLDAIALQQKVGRTLTNVQHLTSGASFTVSGHSVSAAVRGTQFEILVRTNNTNRIWVFVGSVRISGKTQLTLTAGQEIDAAADGTLSNLRSNQFDAVDPFPMAVQCSASASNGNNAGTMDAATGDALTNGQSAENDYYSAGGSLSVALCYPGSLMSVTVTDPNGGQYSRQGPPPINLKIPNGPPGVYKAVVRAVNVRAGGEAYSVAFATDAACNAGNVDTGVVVRETLSNSQIATALAESGTSGVTIFIQGTSPTSSRITYYSDVVATPLSWTIDFYPATPNLGAVITQVTVHGISVSTAAVSNLTSFGGHSISSIPSGFVVDRVYSCAGPNNDNLMVVEGHR